MSYGCIKLLWLELGGSETNRAHGRTSLWSTGDGVILEENVH